MSATKNRHDVSVVKLGNLFFWKCSCGSSASRGAFTRQDALRHERSHRR